MVIIIGSGLSGLLTGYLLKKEGISFKILEARDRVGGRINTLYDINKAPLEMGATWFTNQHTHLIGLLKELDIPYFKQSMDSNVFYETSANSPAQFVQIPSQGASLRIAGGSSSLINALITKLDEKDIVLNQSVKNITVNKKSVLVNTEQIVKASKVVLAIPPKLWAKNIMFEPQLPKNLLETAKQTQTWMEDSIKVAVTYNERFWGNENLPGTLFSNIGPIIEFYDHSNHENSKYALCGFADTSLKNLTYSDRKEKIISQLKKVFGSKALAFTSYEECIWSKEKNTFVASDTFLMPHQNNGNPIYSNSLFEDKLLIASTESSAIFAGYMEGAVYSAKLAVNKIKLTLS